MLQDTWQDYNVTMTGVDTIEFYDNTARVFTSAPGSIRLSRRDSLFYVIDFNYGEIEQDCCPDAMGPSTVTVNGDPISHEGEIIQVYIGL